MPRLSQAKFKKICEHALEFLYTNYPNAFFTAVVARELARDEEFMKRALFDLESKGLVTRVNSSPTGKEYLERTKWVLSRSARERYEELSG